MATFTPRVLNPIIGLQQLISTIPGGNILGQDATGSLFLVGNGGVEAFFDGHGNQITQASPAGSIPRNASPEAASFASGNSTVNAPAVNLSGGEIGQVSAHPTFGQYAQYIQSVQSTFAGQSGVGGGGTGGGLQGIGDAPPPTTPDSTPPTDQTSVGTPFGGIDPTAPDVGPVGAANPGLGAVTALDTLDKTAVGTAPTTPGWDPSTGVPFESPSGETIYPTSGGRIHATDYGTPYDPASAVGGEQAALDKLDATSTGSSAPAQTTEPMPTSDVPDTQPNQYSTTQEPVAV